MRVTVAGHEVEGTVEEIVELLSMMQKAGPAASVAPSSRSAVSPFVSEEVALAVLTRRPLGEAHANLLRTLDGAGEDWTAAPDLQGTLGLTTREFAGLLGAFGKRLANTEGAGSRSFLDQYWDHEQGYNLYRLPPSVRAALRRAEVVS